MEISVHSWGSDWTRVLHPLNLLCFCNSTFLNGGQASFTDMDLAPSFTCTMEVPHTRLLEFEFYKDLGIMKTSLREWTPYTDCPSLALFLLSLPDPSGGSPFPVLRYLHKAISSWLWVWVVGCEVGWDLSAFIYFKFLSYLSKPVISLRAILVPAG